MSVCRGTLSSYAYVLLCIFLLQSRTPAILPVLQASDQPTVSLSINSWVCQFDDDMNRLSGFGAGRAGACAPYVVVLICTDGGYLFVDSLDATH